MRGLSVRHRLLACAVLLVGCKRPGASEDYFGKLVIPPHGLDKVRLGMTPDDAKSAIPAFVTSNNGKLVLPSGAHDVELFAQYDKPPSVIVKVVARVTHGGALAPHGSLELALDKSWGHQVASRMWTSAAWRALLVPGADHDEVEFYPALTASFFAAPGALPVPLAKVERGMTRHQIDEIVPPITARYRKLVEGNMTILFDHEDRATGVDGITIWLHADHDRAIVLAAWGPGRIETTPIGMDLDFDAPHVYVDRAAGWRTSLYPAKPGRPHPAGVDPQDMLIFTAFTPAVQLLGPGVEVACLDKPVIGTTYEQALASYAGTRDKPPHLPATEYADQTLLTFEQGAGKVTGELLELGYGDAGARDALRALFDAKWGVPPAAAAGQPIVYRAKAPHVEAVDTGRSWRLAIR